MWTFSASIIGIKPLVLAPERLLSNCAVTISHNAISELLSKSTLATPGRSSCSKRLGRSSRGGPFHGRFSDAERNRRLTAAFEQAGRRLQSCAQTRQIDLTSSSDPLHDLWI